MTDESRSTVHTYIHIMQVEHSFSIMCLDGTTNNYLTVATYILLPSAKLKTHACLNLFNCIIYLCIAAAITLRIT